MTEQAFTDATQIKGGDSAEPIVTMEHVVKRFKDFTALKDINFRVGRQEVVVVIGPSGSGKSTMIRCINDL